eukprot:TRINITY_DN17618_c0_g1_i1.p1 TRINITY_DN17618_c0_g1~~TRINITY_DN17618_c0_g1_i1.p1  ORF type:complete len:718 (+),score=145.74 TRINITY_DN17618_c0_g1_i1:72-2156(+)
MVGIYTAILQEGVSILVDLQEIITPKKFRSAVERWALVLSLEQAAGGSTAVEAEVQEIACYGVDGEGLVKSILEWVEEDKKVTMGKILMRGCSPLPLSPPAREADEGTATPEQLSDWQEIKKQLNLLLTQEIPSKLRQSLLQQFCGKAAGGGDAHRDVVNAVQLFNEGIHLLSFACHAVEVSKLHLSIEDFMVEKAQERTQDLLQTPDKILNEGVMLSDAIVEVEKQLFSAWFDADLLYSCPRATQHPQTTTLLKTLGCIQIPQTTDISHTEYCDLFIDLLSNLCTKQSPSSWSAHLWESSQHAQVSDLLKKLRKETWSVPMSVHSPLDSYIDKLEGFGSPQNTPPKQMLATDACMGIHQFLLEVREDLQSTLESSKIATNRQLLACGNVVSVIHTTCVELLNGVVNLAHTNIERLGFMSKNVLPAIYFASDVFLITTIHFQHPAIDLLQPDTSRSAPSPHLDQSSHITHKIDIVKLNQLSGTPPGHSLPGNLPDLAIKCAVLLGVCVDKIRTEIGKVALSLMRAYCVTGVKDLPEAESDAVADEEEESTPAEWDSEYSKTVSRTIATLVDPLCTLARHIPPEIGLYISHYTVTTVVELMCSQVATYLLRKPASLTPHGEELPAWPPTFAPALVTVHPCLCKLSTDLQHLRDYLSLETVNGLNTYFLLPCWEMPFLLANALDQQEKENHAAENA